MDESTVEMYQIVLHENLQISTFHHLVLPSLLFVANLALARYRRNRNKIEIDKYFIQKGMDSDVLTQQETCADKLK